MSDEQDRPPSRRPFLGAAGSGTLSNIKHIVIFMQENRAFEHYFGTLNGVRGFGDRNAVALPGGKPVRHQPNSTNPDGHILPFRMNTATTNSICAGAATMDWSTDLGTYNGGKFDSWSSGRTPAIDMGRFARKDLDFYYGPANAFTLCDHYFQSTLTQTNPNRLHVFTGSNGGPVGQSAIMDNSEPSAGFTWTTYAERLRNAGISWKVYQQSDNFNDNALAWFAGFKNAKADRPLYDRDLATVPGLVAAFGNNLANSTLPQVSWIVAPAIQSEHANYRPTVGTDPTARLLKQLAAHPDVWSNTAFLLEYDENGGFFDHVPPPMPPTSDSNGLSTVTTSGEIPGGKQTSLGFRVPIIVISPWTRQRHPSARQRARRRTHHHVAHPLEPRPDPFPHDIRFDLGTARTATGLTYLPRPDGGNGRIGSDEIATSSDGTTWSSPVASGTWADDAKPKAVTFPATTARWVRLRPHRSRQPRRLDRRRRDPRPGPQRLTRHRRAAL
ncbi:alkaline phosphatase family protein [Kitasatospora sp. NPDC057198]|uniref:alkaline phosphatase family protein n=1 Tax=Kitasatospora sp. NPDC057198 TaxID=3346046 RepID=UPI00362FB158